MKLQWADNTSLHVPQLIDSTAFVFFFLNPWLYFVSCLQNLTQWFICLQFRSIASLITNFKSSIGSVDHVTSVLKKLEQTNVSMTTRALSEEEAWQKSAASFIYNLEENYPHYRDITVPFLVAVYQVMKLLP